MWQTAMWKHFWMNPKSEVYWTTIGTNNVQLEILKNATTYEDNKPALLLYAGPSAWLIPPFKTGNNVCGVSDKDTASAPDGEEVLAWWLVTCNALLIRWEYF